MPSPEDEIIFLYLCWVLNSRKAYLATGMFVHWYIVPIGLGHNLDIIIDIKSRITYSPSRVDLTSTSYKQGPDMCFITGNTLFLMQTMVADTIEWHTHACCIFFWRYSLTAQEKGNERF